MIGITIPVIYNQSYGVYYQSGNRKTPKGGATSYGLDICYKHPVYKSIFVKAAAGVFKQNFKIERPFNFDDPTRLLFYTKSYTYINFDFQVGFGVQHNLGEGSKLELLCSYFYLYSIKQRYSPTYLSNSSFQSSQSSSKSFNVGSAFNTEFGINKNVSENISVGISGVITLLGKWANDPIFINTYYATDQTVIAKNKFSGGLSFSTYYHF